MESDRVIPRDILDDLCSRFIINVPDEERRDLIRICFQIESAHWFYLDFYSKHFPTKKTCGIKEFAQQIFKHLPFLQPYANNVEKIIDDWKDYKFCVPTFGAILLDEDLSHVLLVQSYCSRSSWGFPKGKVNKDEPPYQCAIREVYEETGFDISNLINANEYIETNFNDQVVRLYLIPGINKQEKFEPKTRNEIKAVNWFPICDIPSNKREASLKLGTNANSFFLVSPFLRRLRQWIFDRSRRLPLKHSPRQRHKSCSDIDGITYGSSTLNLKESVAMLKSFNDKKGDQISDKMESSYEANFETAGEKGIENKQVAILHQPQFKDFEIASTLSQSSVPMSSSYSIGNVPFPQNVEILSHDSAFRKVEKSTKSKKRNRGKKLLLSKQTKGEEENLFFNDAYWENTNHNSRSMNNACPDNIDVTSSVDNHKAIVPSLDGKSSSFEEQPLVCVSRWMNFKFDINAIMRSMDEACLIKR